MSNTTTQHKQNHADRKSALDLYKMPFEYNVTIAEEKRSLQSRTQ